MSLLQGLPAEHYRCILADPPWHFKSNSRAKPGRNPLAHYDCLSLEDIAAFPVKQFAAPDSWLFFWITGPFLARGAHLPIFRAWGFEPSGMGFVWIKLNPKAPQMIFMPHDVATGPGFTTRKNAEFVVLGRRGQPQRLSKAIHEVILAPRRQHSRKPDEAHERIERFCEGPRLELFGRQQRPGWTVVGNQADKFAFQGGPQIELGARPEAIPEPAATQPRPDAAALLAKLRDGAGRLGGIPRLDVEAVDIPDNGTAPL